MEKLIWQQDFVHKHTNLEEWNIRLGNNLLDENGNAICPGWGNGELQFYTSNSSNVYFDEQGLNISACREQVLKEGSTYGYTSARLDTRGHFSYCYGKLVIRAKLPVGQGLWPAIWLLPEHQSYGAWPASGEIDIMEARGRLPKQVSGTLHYGKDMETKATDEFTYHLEQGTINQFREYTLEWSKQSIRWLVDGNCYAERQLLPDTMPFDKPFYIVLNLAVGGWYDRVDVDDAVFPATMTISDIKLFQ